MSKERIYKIVNLVMSEALSRKGPDIVSSMHAVILEVQNKIMVSMAAIRQYQKSKQKGGKT